MPRQFGLGPEELRRLECVELDMCVTSEVLEHLKASTSEFCGALYGKVEGTLVRVLSWRRCPTSAASPDSFVLQLENLLKPADCKELRLVGILHSHICGSTGPSRIDQFFIERTPLVWVIVGPNPQGSMLSINAYVGGSALTRLVQIQAYCCLGNMVPVTKT